MKPMNLFQPMERLRTWSTTIPYPVDDLQQVQLDAAHVLARHDLLHRMAGEREKHVWYQVGSEGNGNVDISWRERAEEMEVELSRCRKDAARWQHVRSANLIEMLGLYPTCETCDVGLDYAVDCAIEAKEILES